MRVLPFVGMTAPLLPLEKSYSFFIPAALPGLGAPDRDDPELLASTHPHNDPHCAKVICSNRDKALLTIRGVILDRHRHGVSQHAVAFRPCNTVLAEIEGV